MKKRYLFRIFLGFLTLAMLLPLVASCKQDVENGTESDTKAESKNESQTVEEIRDFFGANAKDFVVIYSTSAKKSVQETAKNLATIVNGNFGLSLRCRTDTAVTASKSPYEILVGDTNRSESKKLSAELTETGYGIRIVGTKLAICGTDANMTVRAVENFLEKYVIGKSGTLKLPENYSVLWKFSEQSPSAFTLAQNYKIIYPESNNKNEKVLAGELAEALDAMTGSKPLTVSDYTTTAKGQRNVTNTDAEILIGATNRSVSEENEGGLSNYYDYRLWVTDKKVVISGSSAGALRRAIDKFVEMLWNGEINLTKDTTEDGLFYSAENYSAVPDVTAFVPSWSGKTAVASWQTNLDEKIFAVTTVDARNMSAVRYGDTKNYTSCSYEAFASAILCGTDLISVDVYESKDGILVVAPAATLEDNTNASEQCAKIGASSTLKISDWTWEQIASVRLKNSEFGRLLTLNEVVELCRDRCMIYPTMYVDSDWSDLLLYDVFSSLSAVKSYYVPDPHNVTLEEPKVMTVLKDWYKRGRTNESVSSAYQYWQTCIAKTPNHWSRLLWTVSGKEGNGLWQSMRDEWKTFLYTADTVTYSAYIAKQSPATEIEDVTADATYTISKSDLGLRVMILSDTHYYTTSNIKSDNLGMTKEQKKNLLVAQIKKEIADRGLDAILVLGDLATDNWTVGLADSVGSSDMYTKNTYYAKTFYDDCLKQFESEVGIYVLAGNHDSFLNDKWREMFGTDRQFSFKIGNTAFIMLDTFADTGSNSKNNGSSYVGIDKTWLAGEMAKYTNCKVVVCSHYFSSVAELKELSDQYTNIIGFYHGHTHLYEAVDVGNGTVCINDGGFSYTAFADESGTSWNFEFFDPRSAWGYCILESDTSSSKYVTYRTSLAVTYRADNITYTIANERKSADIALN